MKIFVLIGLIYIAFFVLMELVAALIHLQIETSRKLIHITAGITVAFLPYVLSFQEIIYLSLLFVLLMTISRQKNLFSSIHSVSRYTYGEIYFPAAVCIMAAFFPTKLLFGYGILIMSISDGLASLVGQRLGKRNYKFFNANKSYLGSFVFFLSSIAIGFMVFLVAGLPINILSISFIFIFAIILTAAEASLSFGLDNLILPPLAGMLLLFFLKIFSIGR